LLLDYFAALSPVVQALVATCFTWGVTALGAALVFVVRTERRVVLDTMLGFTGGVMVAASFWSLLLPAVGYAEGAGEVAWIPVTLGFLLGAGFLLAADRLLPHLHLDAPGGEVEGIPTEWRRSSLLIAAITLHNVPEGLAVGVAFGAAAASGEPAAFVSACTLALGIGLQNFPEGLAVSFPLRRAGLSGPRAFAWGQLSGTVEPVAGVLGAAAVAMWMPVLPWALAFAAGAMIFVVFEEVIPEAHRGGHGDWATLGAIVGFAVMTGLDVGLG
jgi:ZIP family zinc transporter